MALVKPTLLTKIWEAVGERPASTVVSIPEKKAELRISIKDLGPRDRERLGLDIGIRTRYLLFVEGHVEFNGKVYSVQYTNYEGRDGERKEYYVMPDNSYSLSSQYYLENDDVPLPDFEEFLLNEILPKL